MAMLDRFIGYINTTEDTVGASNALNKFINQYGAPLIFTSRLNIPRIFSRFSYYTVTNLIENFGGANLWGAISSDPRMVHNSIEEDGTGFMLPAVQKSILYMMNSYSNISADDRSMGLLYNTEEITLTNEFTGEVMSMSGRDIDTVISLADDGWECRATVDDRYIYENIIPKVVVSLFERGINNEHNIDNISVVYFGEKLSKLNFTKVMDIIVDIMCEEIRRVYLMDYSNNDIDDNCTFVHIFQNTVELVRTQMEVIRNGKNDN